MTLSQNPAESVITTETLPILEESIHRILLSAGCENVWSEPMPPVSTWEEFIAYIKVLDDIEFDKHEAWFISRLGFRHDPNTFGTFTKYEKLHRLSIHGVMWVDDFSSSYTAMQTQVEKNGRWLEKNKGGLHTLIHEFSEISVDFTPQMLGDTYLYHSTMTLSALMAETETGGRQ